MRHFISVVRLLIRWLPLALLAGVAFWLRTHDLEVRPMHADEANQAVKAGDLLARGDYAFDPRDHHGPTLYYAALFSARVRGERTLAELSERTVRLVPAVFGTITVILVGLFGSGSRPEGSGGIGRWAALAAALFVAVSPPAVYYSRYFVQETLLGTFTLATFLSLRAWWRSGLTRWAIVAGIGAGLMQATKASAPLFLVLALIALLLVRGQARPATRRPRRDAFVALLAAGMTAAVFFSSFGTHLAGLRDALQVYTHALTRFGAESAPTGHEKPWWYYLRLFGWTREGGLLWHQIGFSALALAGLAVAWRRRDAWVRGMAVYAVLLTGVFSFFAYKTPWHALHFVPAYALLAGAALAALAQLRFGPVLAAATLLAVAASLGQQVWRTSFFRPADWRNPYAYVHSSADVRKFRALVEAALAARPGEPIRIVSEEYWPLPWYLRGLPNVGYWMEPPTECDGALIIASPTQAEAVRARLRRPYRESILGLRPGFVCIVSTPEP